MTLYMVAEAGPLSVCDVLSNYTLHDKLTVHDELLVNRFILWSWAMIYNLVLRLV